ncbi:MAG TPA: hypothetical protein VKC35_07535 [Vicinamibacterales bacterium]|nr:hypothetical protein [Vicinamibacterales bacterium]
MANLNQDQLRRLARLGAQARLEELRQEEAAIRSSFPDLFGRVRRTQAVNGQASTARRRPAMSAAARKAVSTRMRKYWAERRKSKAGK